MKNFKLILFIALIAFSSCSSNDDSETTPGVQEIKATLNLSALSSLSGNDATSLITFNGVPAAQHTTEALVGDEIVYIIDTDDPSTVIRYTEYRYASGDDNLWGSLESVHDGTGWLVGLKVNEDAELENECKFDMQFQLEVNGVLQTNKTYLIDPKIKIRSKRPSNNVR